MGLLPQPTGRLWHMPLTHTPARPFCAEQSMLVPHWPMMLTQLPVDGSHWEPAGHAEFCAHASCAWQVPLTHALTRPPLTAQSVSAMHACPLLSAAHCPAALHCCPLGQPMALVPQPTLGTRQVLLMQRCPAEHALSVMH